MVAILSSEFENYARQHNKLHPAIMVEQRAVFARFKVPFDPATARIVIEPVWRARLWFLRTYRVILDTIHIRTGSLKHKSGHVFMLPATIAGLSHELYHVYQFQRDGSFRTIGNWIRSAMRSLTGRRWHSSEFEMEALQFETRTRSWLEKK